MRGRRAGRLVVVGYWGPKRDRNGNCKGGGENQVWVCRCSCGLFVTRTAKTIIAARDPDDKCDHCRQLEYIQRLHIKETTGKWPLSECERKRMEVGNGLS